MTIIPGHAEVKGYPVSGDELWLLGGIGGFSTACFSGASGLVGYYVNTGVNLALAQGVAENIVSSYQTSRSWALAGALIFFVLGAGATVLGGLKVRAIINRTKHDDSK